MATSIFQDNKGEITDLVNHSIEQIICIDGVEHNNLFANILLIWIKLEEKECWYRIFFDAGYCFCSVYNSSEFTENYQEDIYFCENDNSIYQIESHFELKGLTVVSASVYPINTNESIDIYGVELAIIFHNGERLIMQGKKFDSDINLLIIKS